MSVEASPAKESTAKTPLYDLHLELGGKMVPFAGYEMPVQYQGMGIIKEHLHTREQAGLFDVSHMGQLVLQADDIASALEKLVPVDLQGLEINRSTYAVFTNENGGILDDLIITRWADDRFFVVVNAACKEQDIAHLESHLSAEMVQRLDQQALLALQGPVAHEVMSELAPEVSTLVFMSGCEATIDGVPVYITRSGYTGEDGFEISIPADQADKIARRILAFDQVQAIGLGARDSLRLEAGLCLYGHDMDIESTPVEASLSWSISKPRRSGADRAGGFPGAAAILRQMEEGATRKRVGLTIEGRVPVREGAELFDAQDNRVGEVTSGGFAPSLGSPIAMGYVESGLSGVGTILHALVRGKKIPVQVAKMPFVPQKYYRG